MIKTTDYFDELIREKLDEMAVRECSECGEQLYDISEQEGEVTCADHGGVFSDQ